MRAALVSSIVLAVACGGGSSTTTSSNTTASTASTQSTATMPTSFNVTVSGAGRPVIFIPGLTCDGHVWDATIAHLHGTFETHVLSLAGFSGTPAIDKPLLPTVHDELIAYIKDHHLDHPILVGHSLGGFMTYWIAETAPDLIAGGVAVDGAPFLPALMNPAATVETSAKAAAMMRDHMVGKPDEFAESVKQFYGGMILEPSKHMALIEASAKSDPKTTGEAMFFLMQTDLRGEAGKIKAPMTIIAADGNGEIPRDVLEATWHAQIDSIPTHQLVVVDHSKHFVMLDQPDAFYAALDAALAKK